MSIISYSEDNVFTIDFNIKEGEDKKWYSKIDICDNPICHCQEMTFELYDTENKEATLPKHRLSVDVFAQKAVKLKGENATSNEDFQLTKSFVKNLSENDWKQLRIFFLDFKKKITESTPIANLHIPFPEKLIEQDALMIGYYEIFPYAEKLSLELDNTEYLIDDQYCLSSTCSCTHAALTFLAIKNGRALDNKNPLAIMFDYKTNSYKVENRGPQNIATPKELVDEVLRKHLGKTFKEHHKKLRFLYNKFKKNKPMPVTQSLDKPLLSTKTNEHKKIGRNKPCPCGSGKKYKKCCMT